MHGLNGTPNYTHLGHPINAYHLIRHVASGWNKILKDKFRINLWIRSFTNSVENIPSDKELQEKLSYKVFEKFRSQLHVEGVPKTHLVKINFTSRDPKMASQIANAIGEAYVEENLFLATKCLKV